MSSAAARALAVWRSEATLRAHAVGWSDWFGMAWESGKHMEQGKDGGVDNANRKSLEKGRLWALLQTRREQLLP